LEKLHNIGGEKKIYEGYFLQTNIKITMIPYLIPKMKYPNTIGNRQTKFKQQS